MRCLSPVIQVQLESLWGNPQADPKIPTGTPAKPNTTFLLFLRHGGWFGDVITGVRSQRQSLILSLFIADRELIVNLVIPLDQMFGGKASSVPEAALPYQSCHTEGGEGEKWRREPDKGGGNLFARAGSGGAQLGLPCFDSVPQGPGPDRTAHQDLCESESQLQCRVCCHKVKTKWYQDQPMLAWHTRFRNSLNLSHSVFRKGRKNL